MFTVSCSACAAQYQLDEAKVGPAGRKLKCAKCGHVWVAMKPVEAEPVEPVVVKEDDRAGQEPENGLESGGGGENDGAEFADVSAVAEVGRRPWLAWVRGPRLWRLVGWLLIVGGLVAGGWTVWFGWQPKEIEQVGEAVVEGVQVPVVVPQVVSAPEGVVLQGVRAEFSGVGEGVVLTVRGRVKNVGEVSVTLPQLQVELLGRDGAVADVWPVRFADMRLGPDANMAWEVSFTNPPMQDLAGWRAVFVR